MTLLRLYRGSIPLVGFEPLYKFCPPPLGKLLLQHSILVIEPLEPRSSSPSITSDPIDASDFLSDRRGPKSPSTSSAETGPADKDDCFVIDFLPIDPTSPSVTARMLLLQKVPGRHRIRRISRPPLLYVQVVGEVNLTLNHYRCPCLHRLLLAST